MAWKIRKKVFHGVENGGGTNPSGLRGRMYGGMVPWGF